MSGLYVKNISDLKAE